MPQFDESFLSDCGLAERWRFYSYTVKQQVHDEQQQLTPHNYAAADHHHHHQQQQQQHYQHALLLPRDNNNNNSSSSNKNTLHDIKFHRRRKYKKLPRLVLSTNTTATTTTTTAQLATAPATTTLTPPCLLFKNVVHYGSISTPSTPSNCSAVGVGGCSSSSNNSINSNTYPGLNSSTASTPPPPQSLAATTPQQSVRFGGGSGGVPPAPPSASGATGSSGHKNSLKGTKLARRARSFKDDLIEKISLMRTTNNTLGRSHSPHSPRNKHASKGPPTNEEVQRSTHTLETHVKDISNALKHFRDVILKKKLEVLPGNGTVILETIASMYSVIQSNTLNENSAIMSSATQQVSQSLGKLIKLCDEVMLNEKSGECASLSNENVREVIDLLEDAVRNLVTLAQGKLKEQDQCTYRSAVGPGLCGIGAAADIIGAVATVSGAGSAGGIRVPTDAVAAAVAQRTSLPDIGLTPKERDILEQSNGSTMRGSHSTESILRDTSPPPKPPLPNRASNPPPLPPKRRSQPQSQLVNANTSANTNTNTTSHSSQANSPLPYAHSHNISLNSDLDCSSNISLLSFGVDRLSVRSRSPDENSQCSFESALNHSREEEEHLQKLPMRVLHHQQDDDVDGLLSYSFVSMMSFRTSTQSVSKLSSEHSVQSSTKSSSSNSEIAFGISETTTMSATTATSSSNSSSSTTNTNNNNSEYQQLSQTQSTQRHITSNSSTISSNNGTSSTTATAIATTTKASAMVTSNSSDQLTTKSKTSLTTSLQSLSNSCPLTELAPALPPKQQQRTAVSRFDAALDELDDSSFELAELRHLPPIHCHHQHHSSSTQLHQWQAKHHSLIEPPRSAQLPISCSSAFDPRPEKPPPLPMKQKKNILAYMEICSANSHSVEQHRHTMHTYNISRNISHSQTMNIMPFSKELSPEQETPPALPPKNYKPRKPSTTTMSLPTAIVTTPPSSPKPMLGDGGLRNSRMTTVCEELNDVPANSVEDTAQVIAVKDSNENVAVGGQTFYCHSHELPSETMSGAVEQTSSPVSTPKMLETSVAEHVESEEAQQPMSGELELELEEEDEEEEEEEVDNQLPNMLEETDITLYLILKKNEEDGPEVKGGYIDALIVHASRVQTRAVADNAFSEAFITTFRTFIQPIDVIEKLTHRFTYFFCQVHDQKQKAANETFSLLVRVVNDLTSTDLTSQLFSLLVEFVYQLVCSGELYKAKLLRSKFVEKVTLYKDQKNYAYALERDQLPILGGVSSSSSGSTISLLDLKSLEIAEQMTLLDAELFQKIEIPEVLLFAKDQCEEKSPNLNKFTEHFNKMSYWARSKILRLQDAKEREKHVNKFIKIMKHLRKMNNYNSYLALLSALDSGPIRRLEWQKGITEEVRSFCTLIDSSSSFRTYRQALAETTPPCIPYIGLVLQDLTFVHVGNQDYMSKGVINFSKRWQQYNIIDNMKRFKKCAYPFRRNERIIGFFDTFKDFMGEEEMWQISERLKPRGRRNVNY